QAEDGIRDRNVTGVQTCALPILARRCHLQEEVYKSQHLLGTIGLLQGNALKASKHYEAAIVQIERMLDNLAYDLSPSFLRTAWRSEERRVGKECRLQGGTWQC